MIEVAEDDFDDLVLQALDRIPEELLGLIDNCVVLVEAEPPEGEPRDLLGLYDGVPLTERGADYGFTLPDRIFIYRQPILRLSDSYERVVHEVHITVVHEIAHHFGIADEQLHAWGYG